MDRPRARPVFSTSVADPEAVLAQIGANLADCDPNEVVTGQVFRKHAVLQIAETAAHFWSPYLYLEARHDDDDDEPLETPMLRGRFAPHPHVWTMFMAIHGVVGMCTLGAGLYGLSSWWLGWSAWPLLLVPAGLATHGFVHGAAFIGQGLGAEQMYTLRAFVDRAVADASQARAAT